MRNVIKKLFTKEIIIQKEVSIDIVVPKFDTLKMLSDKDQAKEFYLFLCSRYIGLVKEGKYDDSKVIEKLIQDLVIYGEGIQFYGLKKTYSIK